MRVIGYLTGVANPNFSGLATVTIRTRLHRTQRRPGKVVTCYCDAGYGVRRLVDAFGVNGRLEQASGRIRAVFDIDDTGLLASVEWV